jgi:hypothetical protein
LDDSRRVENEDAPAIENQTIWIRRGSDFELISPLRWNNSLLISLCPMKLTRDIAEINHANVNFDHVYMVSI